MPTSQSAYVLVGLTALVAGLIGVLAFAVLRFGAAAREMRRRSHDADSERAFVSAALQDAIRKLREQERAMAARAESSERLNGEIVSSLASGLLVVGLDGVVRALNPAGLRLLHLPALEPGTTLRALLAEAPALIQVVEECLDTARPVVRRSIKVPRPDGTDTHLGVTVSPLRGDQGTSQGAICLFSDLTAVIDLEEQVRLKDSLARLGELTAGLAHEFRNGLATIHGYGRLIDPGLVPADYAPYVQGIRDEAEALGRVVNNFLNFARPAQLTLAPLQLGEVVASAVTEVQAEIGARGGSISVAGEYGLVDADEILLRQALVNLLRNAVDACSGAAIVPRLEVDGRLDPGQGVVRLSVADNGPGIAPALRERIFRPFFTTKSHGTGLGLALVQKIVVTHNGRISVGATDDGGASFQIVLPLAGHH
jgi:two-component system, NtrC family, sensor histidine kinase HydH